MGILLAPLGVQALRGLDLGQPRFVEPYVLVSFIGLIFLLVCGAFFIGLFIGLWNLGDDNNYDCPTVDACLNWERAKFFARVYPEALNGQGRSNVFKGVRLLHCKSNPGRTLLQL